MSTYYVLVEERDHCHNRLPSCPTLDKDVCEQKVYGGRGKIDLEVGQLRKPAEFSYSKE